MQGRGGNNLEHYVARRVIDILNEFELEEAVIFVGEEGDSDSSCYISEPNGTRLRFLDQPTMGNFPYESCGEVVDILVPFAVSAQRQASLERSLVPFTDEFSEVATRVGAYQAFAQVAANLDVTTLRELSSDLPFQVDIVSIDYDDWVGSQVLQPSPVPAPVDPAAVSQSILLDRVTGSVSAVYPEERSQVMAGIPVRAFVFSPRNGNDDIVDLLLGQQSLGESSLVVTKYEDAGWLVSNFSGLIAEAPDDGFGTTQNDFIVRFILDQGIPADRLPVEYQWLPSIDRP